MAKTLTTSWQTISSYAVYPSGYTLTFYVDARYTTQSTSDNYTHVETRLRSVTSAYPYSDNYHTFTCTYCSNKDYYGRWTYETETIISGSADVTHNNDGTKSVQIEGSVYDSAWGWNFVFGELCYLPTIPRYATVTTSTSNVTDTTVDVSWSSNAAVDQVQYRLNSGSWVDVETGVDKTSGSYTIRNLSPGTTYTIDFDYKRKDSQQWSYSAGYAGSSTITTRRYPVPSTTISNITQTSVQINWSTDVNVDTAQYRLNSGSWVNAQTGLNTSSGSYTISGLSPGTTYTFDFDYKRYNTSSDWSSYAGRTNTTVKTTLDYMVRIKVNSSWKEAIPYININGTWKKAVPYIKINGSWKLGI